MRLAARRAWGYRARPLRTHSLMALVLCGVADAATVPRGRRNDIQDLPGDGEMAAGLCRSEDAPRMFARAADAGVARVVEIARERAEQFASTAPALSATFAGLKARVRAQQPFLDLAWGVDGHVRRHLLPLTAARTRILSYLEAGDLRAIDAAIAGGFPILRRIAATPQAPASSIASCRLHLPDAAPGRFLKAHRQDLRQFRASALGELGHPFPLRRLGTVGAAASIIRFVKEGVRIADCARCELAESSPGLSGSVAQAMRAARSAPIRAASGGRPPRSLIALRAP